MRNTNTDQPGHPGDVRVQEFLDMIAPSVVKFNTDHFICGNTFRCVWALREYPTSTEEQAILKRLGEKDGVTLRIYTRHVNAAEERKIISNAASKNRMERANTNDLQQTVMAESNLQDVATIVAQTHRNREPLLHTAVYIELSASDYDRLKLLQTEVLTELIRSKLNVDRLMLRQQQGFQSVMPSGRNVFRDQFERVLPASSVANLYPFNYSGKTDPHGFYVGRDKFGSNVLVDFNQRAEDKTNGSILILGNSGQGKSYLLKLILCNLRESGMNVICLDPEMEYEDLTNNLQGCFIDLMGGRYIINPLEPKVWDEGDGPEDPDAPETFRISSRLSQHISFLKDFFRKSQCGGCWGFGFYVSHCLFRWIFFCELVPLFGVAERNGHICRSVKTDIFLQGGSPYVFSQFGYGFQFCGVNIGESVHTLHGIVANVFNFFRQFGTCYGFYAGKGIAAYL